jgi:uncharacterized membrane protein
MRTHNAVSSAQAHNPVSTANFHGHPLHPMLVTLPIGFWIATLLADLGYWKFHVDGWATAAMWLLGAGIVGGVVAAIAGYIDFRGDERIRALDAAQLHATGNVIAILVALFSFAWRYNNGAAGVLPTGLILSFAVVGIIMFTGWKGGEMVYHHRVAVADEPRPAQQTEAMPGQSSWIRR